MIILKHLTVERFRLLREVNLHFPQRGSILIQGPNESGKSALLESIYFALYGTPLTAERGKQSLDNLIMYGATQATVTLTLSVSTTELTITRTIERGKGQKVTLYIYKSEMPEEEPITRLIAANERILSELGRIDGETVRNSCLLEQKGLERLELLRGSEREASVRKLLGIEKLIRMTEHFKVTPQDEGLLKEVTERFRLAQTQAQIPELSQRLEHIEAALDAVTVAEKLEEIHQQEAEIAEQEQEIKQVAAKRLELKNRQGRVQQLKKTDATLGEIIEAYDAIAEARRELPALEKQIADLERRELEELPVQEKRVQELAELTKSFGTLQRMSSDLLAAVDTVKELERVIKEHKTLTSDLSSLEEQTAQTQARVEQTQKLLHDLEEHDHTRRPVLETRLSRMKVLAERLRTLQQLEEQYSQHLAAKERANENQEQLGKVQKDLRETEHKLKLAEDEAKQVQQQAEELETTWRQLSIRRQIKEWQRLKGLAQRLAEAEQQVRLAHMEQEKLTLATLEARRSARLYLLIVSVCAAFFLICLVVAAIEGFQHEYLLAIIAGIVALLLGTGAAFSLQNYNKAHREEQATDQQMQTAMSRMSMMVAARETAVRMGGNQEMLSAVEREILALGGTIPGSLDEANEFLQQVPDKDENLADLQQQIKKKRDEANAARNQINVTMEAIATLHKGYARLEEQRKREGWEDIEESMRKDQAALEHTHQEITLLAGQEGLPLASVNERLQYIAPSTFGSFSTIPPAPTKQDGDERSSGVPDLEMIVKSTIAATEHEIASFDDKLNQVNDLIAQVKVQQGALNALLVRQQTLEELKARYQAQNPVQQLEHTREQQAALRSALQTLQESLRQRVKTLGIGFGQSAVTSAEAAARKQLEELQIIIGNKIPLQNQHAQYTAILKERQEVLSEHYKQLAKLSNSLGSWIVPSNPFAETLTVMRTRCQRELKEADEASILKGFDALQVQEGALKAKITLCKQEIEDAQEHIAGLLIQHNRPTPKSYTLIDITAVWPLLGDYSIEDRSRLEDERETAEQELTRLEQEEQALSTQLHTGDAILDLEQARIRMEQQERSYQTKKRGNQLVKAVNERLMRKMVSRTEYCMQQILPLLTSGRYHDIRLTTEEEEGTSSGGPFRLRVWETAAGEYIPKTTLSGGTADQLSLALRLAFAIAVLPRELTLAPGFLILDEPLSSFDRERTQALVDVVTGESITRHFEQAILISHSSAFDPALFPYHVYLENGVIIESNLPIVQIAQVSPEEQREVNKDKQTSEGDDDADALTMRIAAISLPAGSNK